MALRLNLYGAIDLETGKTIVKDVLTVDAASTIALLAAIETTYPAMRQIHVYLDNARYHHAKLVQAWLERPECRIKLHFVPAYCLHLNPIERLWGFPLINQSALSCTFEGMDAGSPATRGGWSDAGDHAGTDGY
jgi:hypothetical protein